MSDFVWTAERNAELKKLWEDGALSAAGIGKILGCNRNAVIGKAHRLHLPPRGERWSGSRAWTAPETALLIAHWKTRFPVKVLARSIRRTVAACVAHAKHLQLPPKRQSGWTV